MDGLCIATPPRDGSLRRRRPSITEMHPRAPAASSACPIACTHCGHRNALTRPPFGAPASWPPDPATPLASQAEYVYFGPCPTSMDHASYFQLPSSSALTQLPAAYGMSHSARRWHPVHLHKQIQERATFASASSRAGIVPLAAHARPKGIHDAPGGLSG